MAEIDKRLLDCVAQPEWTENLNRILAMIDALKGRVEALETPEGT